MALYRFTGHYKSGAGVWAEGEVVELDETTAAWLLRDVAGCIVPVDATKPQEAPEAPERALEAPQHDRQLKRAPRKR